MKVGGETKSVVFVLNRRFVKNKREKEKKVNDMYFRKSYLEGERMKYYVRRLMPVGQPDPKGFSKKIKNNQGMRLAIRKQLPLKGVQKRQ